MKNNKKRLGDWGEGIAAVFLEGKGYTILSRNFHTKYGELDIIAEMEGSLIFIEVKTRSSNSFAFPEQAVTLRKQQRMIHAAEQYFNQNPNAPESWQFDIIAITAHQGHPPEIEHFENVIN